MDREALSEQHALELEEIKANLKKEVGRCIGFPLYFRPNSIAVPQRIADKRIRRPTQPADSGSRCRAGRKTNQH